MRFLLLGIVGFVLIGAWLCGSIVALAIASPQTNLLEQHAFRHVLELNDFLVIGRYELPADGTADDGVCDTGVPDWDDCSFADAYADLDDANGNLEERISPPTLGPGLFGFYMSAATFAASGITWDDNSTVELFSSPTLFDPSATSGTQPLTFHGTPTTVVATGVEFGDEIRSMLQGMEAEFAGSGTFQFSKGDLVNANLITSTGAAFVIDAFGAAITVSPDHFARSREVLQMVFSPFATASLASDATSGQPNITVTTGAGASFSVDRAVLLSDSSNSETKAILSIAGDVLTMQTNLIFSYTVANSAIVTESSSELQAGIDAATSNDGVRTAVRNFATDFGLDASSGGAIIVIALVLAFAGAALFLGGSMMMALATIPLILIVAGMAGWIPIAAVIVFAAFVGVIPGSAWVWKWMAP